MEPALPGLDANTVTSYNGRVQPGSLVRTTKAEVGMHGNTLKIPRNDAALAGEPGSYTLPSQPYMQVVGGL